MTVSNPLIKVCIKADDLQEDDRFIIDRDSTANMVRSVVIDDLWSDDHRIYAEDESGKVWWWEKGQEVTLLCPESEVEIIG